MKLALAGLSHKTASVEVRERAALSASEVPGGLAGLVARPDVTEALVLHTCNRSELYLAFARECAPPVEELFAQLHDCPPEVLAGHMYLHDDGEAARHLFRVAAGVDSMVFGETEILGQLKRAVEVAHRAGAATRVLGRLGHRALAVGKRVRTETSVDRGATSVASVAVELSRQIFDDLSRARILVLGAGETGQTVALRMVECGALSLVVSSRTRDRAVELAQRVRGRAVGFDDFPEELLSADIVVCCTSAPRVLITPELVRRAVGGHHRRPLFLVDLAVPRDVDPAVGALEDVYLYDIDDLEALVQDNEARRRNELPRVEEIIEREAQDFLVWLKSLEAVPVMLAIREKAESIREEELQALFERLPHLTVRDRKALHLTTKRLVRRLLGAPLDSVRARAGGADAQEYLSLVQELFDVRRAPAECELPPPEEEQDGD